jgi:hypothetical protein
MQGAEIAVATQVPIGRTIDGAATSGDRYRGRAAKRRRRRLFQTTKTEDRVMVAAATRGLRKPAAGAQAGQRPEAVGGGQRRRLGRGQGGDGGGNGVLGGLLSEQLVDVAADTVGRRYPVWHGRGSFSSMTWRS